jgi:hypothetical protein
MTAKALIMCACCLALVGCGNQDNPVQTVVAHPVKGSAFQAGTDGGRLIGQDEAPVASRRRYVAFESRAANLTANDTNGVTDVFVYDNETKQTVRVSISSSGIQGNGGSFSPALTPDGRVVVFESLATNLAPEDTNRHRDIFVHDRKTGMTARVSGDSSGHQANNFSQAPPLSADGRYVTVESFAANLLPVKPEQAKQVFVYDLKTGAIQRAPAGSRAAG